MRKCGLYARVSTDMQAQVKEGSLDTQLDKLRKWVELKDSATDEDWIVAEVYREEGYSGGTTLLRLNWNANRPPSGQGRKCSGGPNRG